MSNSQDLMTCPSIFEPVGRSLDGAVFSIRAELQVDSVSRSTRNDAGIPILKLAQEFARFVPAGVDDLLDISICFESALFLRIDSLVFEMGFHQSATFRNLSFHHYR